MALTIRQNLLDPSKYNLKSPYVMNPSYITVHNTANDASAWGEIAYMISNSLNNSFHFAVDNIEAVQGVPLNRNAWHAGDGDGAGNRQSIGIEICFSLNNYGGAFYDAEVNGAKLVAMLLKQYGWGLDRVKKHQDWSGKYCPHRTLDMGWQRFLNMVASELNASVPTPPPATRKFKAGDKIEIVQWSALLGNSVGTIGGTTGVDKGWQGYIKDVTYDQVLNGQPVTHPYQIESLGRVEMGFVREVELKLWEAPTPPSEPAVRKFKKDDKVVNVTVNGQYSVLYSDSTAMGAGGNIPKGWVGYINNVSCDKVLNGRPVTHPYELRNLEGVTMGYVMESELELYTDPKPPTDCELVKKENETLKKQVEQLQGELNRFQPVNAYVKK